MTISLTDNSPRIAVDFGSITAGQTHKSFTVSFEFFDDADLNVYINGTLKTLTTHYTVTGGNGSTGTISLLTAGTSVTDKVVITRDIALGRTTDFPTSGPFDVTSLNLELDRFTAIAADLNDEIDRSVRLADFDPDVSLVLPVKDSRKGTVLAFNETTGAVENGPTIATTQTVADISADIETVANNVTIIQNITDNLSAVQNAATNAATAITKAGEAATSATASASSATAAQTAQTAAETAETNAETAETNAETAETNAASSATAAASSATTASGHASTATTKAGEAATSATNAATSATNSATSATNSSTSETNASNSATAAASSASAASTSETNAATSETNALSSKTAAANSASGAATSASNSATSASASATSASQSASSASGASTSATNSANSATNSANSASAASTSASNSASSATSASSAQTAAESARDATLAAYDNFDDRYLGAKSSSPTVDNDGNALIAGSLFFDTVNEAMKIYTGSAWVAAYVTGADFIPTSGGGISGDLAFGDNNKAIFGDGNDLQIYHDGFDSWISDAAGLGNLYIRSNDLIIMNAPNNETLLRASQDGAVTAYYNGSPKLATTNNGVVITGQMNSDTVKTSFISNNVATGGLSIGGGAAYNTGANIIMYGESHGQVGAHIFRDGTTYRLRIAGNSGNISFYDSTGVTQGLLWNASTQRLGLGTTAPTNPLHISSNAGEAILVSNSNASGNSQIKLDGATDFQIGTGQASSGFANKFFLYDATNAATRMVVDNSGNVGIGTDAPLSLMHLKQTTGNAILRINSDSGERRIDFGDATDDDGGRIKYDGSDNLQFYTSGTEHMRVDAGGKLNVNNTTGSARVNISADNWPENALALYSAGIAGQTNFAGMGFFNQDADSPIGQVADIYTNPTGTLSLTANGNPAIQLKYGSHGISGGTAALTVDNAGSVGIGTTTPDSLLELYRGTTAELRISTNDAGTAQLSFNEGTSTTIEGFLKYDGASNDVVLGTSGAANALVVDRDTGNAIFSGSVSATGGFVGAGGLPPTIQIFTSSGTWTKPTGCKKIKVTVQGGGGGAGGCTSQGGNHVSQGGGAGGAAIEYIDVTSVASVSVTRGAGGGGGNGSSGNGASGGTSSFGSYCSASGGSGGVARGGNAGTDTQRAGANCGIGSGGIINIKGTRGGSRQGGIGIFQGGAANLIGNGNGEAGLHGSGGGPASSSGYDSNRRGGAGGAGLVMVEEYY